MRLEAGLTCLTVAKSRLSCVISVGVGAALKHLGDESAAGLEHVGGEGRGAFDQAEDAQLVGLAMAGGVGGHVGQHHVGAAAHHGQQFVRRVVG